MGEHNWRVINFRIQKYEKNNICWRNITIKQYALQLIPKEDTTYIIQFNLSQISSHRSVHAACQMVSTLTLLL